MERFIYLTLLLVWAVPVIALHRAVGAPDLRRRARTLIVAVVVPTAYLAIADAVAISSGAWHISNRLTLGVRWRGLVLEEALFFLLTNVMVAQSVILFLTPKVRARALRLVRRVVRRASRPGGVAGRHGR